MRQEPHLGAADQFLCQVPSKVAKSGFIVKKMSPDLSVHPKANPTQSYSVNLYIDPRPQAQCSANLDTSHTLNADLQPHTLHLTLQTLNLLPDRSKLWQPPILVYVRTIRAESSKRGSFKLPLMYAALHLRLRTYPYTSPNMALRAPLFRRAHAVHDLNPKP